MLQFIACENNRYSIPELVQMTIEGGCRWIQLSGADHGETLRETALKVMELCRENDTFLVLEHNVELTDELKVHGVHLFPGDMLPVEAREQLGPHAVIGVTVKCAAEVISLRNADIDYVQIGPYPDVTLDEYRVIVTEVREAGVTIPIVATGMITVEDLKPVMDTGVSGVAVSGAIADTATPETYTSRCIELLNGLL